jgi:hypothetical protein
MNETEWLSCTDPTTMLKFLHCKGSERKLRLFTVGCCRSIWHLLIDERLQRAVEVAERFADGTASTKELASARGAVRAVGGLYYESTVVRAVWSTLREAIPPAVAVASKAAAMALGRYVSTIRLGKAWAVGSVEPLAPVYTTDVAEEEVKQTALLRDIINNPFRTIALDPAWLTSIVQACAESIYVERAFARLPRLADALEDAGCDNLDILNHCRREGLHSRGCWVVDLALGKE